MASSSHCPSSSSHFLPADPNHVIPSSIRPVRTNRQERRAKRRRRRALRMSREKQIPELARHCASYLPSYTSLRSKLHPFSDEEDGKVGQYSYSLKSKGRGGLESPSPCRASAAVLRYDGRLLENRQLSFIRGSDGEADVSDIGRERGPHLFQLRNWRDGSPSSLSSSSSGLPYHATTDNDANFHPHVEIGEGLGLLNACSMGMKTGTNDGGDNIEHEKEKGFDGDNSSAGYWKLQADVLAAECNLLKVEKELALRRWKQGCLDMEPINYRAHSVTGEVERVPMQWKKEHGSSWDTSEEEGAAKEELGKLSCCSNSFALEALQRLQDLSNQGFSRVPNGEPTNGLQERLQKLLLAAHLSGLEHGSPDRTTSHLKFRDVWNNANALGAETRTSRATTRTRLYNDRGHFVEMAGLRKQLNFMSLELSNTGMAATGFVRRECRSVVSEENKLGYYEQNRWEETHCKAALRQIVAQVQAENELWSQLQDLLHTLQEEMGVLNEAREMWEERALRADAQVLCLEEAVHEWRCRAQSAEEELALLGSERQALKIKIQTMKKKHAAEWKHWLKEVHGHTEAVPLPAVETQPVIVATCEAEDQPRPASVGTQEDYALCESIVHSRNESSRSSSGDLGSTSQRIFHKNIKKSLDFSNSSNEGNSSQPRVRSHLFGEQRLKIEPTRLDFCSKSSDVNSKVRHKLSGPVPVVELTRLESIQPSCVNSEYKDRRKVRFPASKENGGRHGLFGHPIGGAQGFQDHVCSPKSSLPSAPTSTPLRRAFGEMSNSPESY